MLAKFLQAQGNVVGTPRANRFQSGRPSVAPIVLPSLLARGKEGAPRAAAPRPRVNKLPLLHGTADEECSLRAVAHAAHAAWERKASLRPGERPGRCGPAFCASFLKGVNLVLFCSRIQKPAPRKQHCSGRPACVLEKRPCSLDSHHRSAEAGPQEESRAAQRRAGVGGLLALLWAGASTQAGRRLKRDPFRARPRPGARAGPAQALPRRRSFVVKPNSGVHMGFDLAWALRAS